MVDLTTFSVDGKHGKKFRKPTNRVEKAGFQFKLLNPSIFRDSDARNEGCLRYLA